MKILFILTEGWGNVCQTVPLYHAMKSTKEHKIDVVYMPQYDSDSAEKAAMFPAPVREMLLPHVYELRKEYDAEIRPPFMLYNEDGEFRYAESVMNNFHEGDSEFKRNMKILDALGIDSKTLCRKISFDESSFEGDVVIHNGSLNAGRWLSKRYPAMHIVAKELKDQGYTVTSIGAPDEYVPGTINGTGTSLRITCGTIKNHQYYIGTDTGSSHAAALLQKKGLIIYTSTDPRKNWDRDFHAGLEPVSLELTCQPCQWGYHFHSKFNECQPDGQGLCVCQKMPPEIVLRRFKSVR